MNSLLILVALLVAIAVLLPVIGLGLALLVVTGCFLIWLLPIVIIAASDRTTGAEKLAWILAIVFLSWFAWIFYFLLAPIKAPPDEHYDYRHRYY